MNGARVIGIALLVCGALGLAYGGFSYTRDTTAVKLGPLELSLKEKRTVDIPTWGSVAALAVGGLLIVFGSARK